MEPLGQMGEDPFAWDGDMRVGGDDALALGPDVPPVGLAVAPPKHEHVRYLTDCQLSPLARPLPTEQRWTRPTPRGANGSRYATLSQTSRGGHMPAPNLDVVGK